MVCIREEPSRKRICDVFSTGIEQVLAVPVLEALEEFFLRDAVFVFHLLADARRYLEPWHEGFLFPGYECIVYTYKTSLQEALVQDF